MTVQHWIRAAALALTSSAVFATATTEAAQRFAALTEDKMTAEQKAVPVVKKALAAGKYNPNGFDAVLLRNPGLQDAVSAAAAEVYNVAARYYSLEIKDRPTVPPGLVEIGILMLSYHWDFPAMFKSHGPVALKSGISQEIVDALAHGKRPAHMKADEEAVYNFCDELIGKHEVSDDTFNEARRYLSERDVVDLVTTLGMYTNSLMMLKVAKIDSH